MLIKFQVYNRRTGQIMGLYSTRERARSAVDRYDRAYGAYANGIREKLVPIRASQREAMGV
jgi:hypothetical protein